MAKQLFDELKGAWRVVKQDLRCQVPKLVRRNLDAGIFAAHPPDQPRQRLRYLRSPIGVDEKTIRFSSKYPRSDVIAIFDQHSGDVRWDVKFDWPLVLDLISWYGERRDTASLPS